MYGISIWREGVNDTTKFIGRNLDECLRAAREKYRNFVINHSGPVDFFGNFIVA